MSLSFIPSTWSVTPLESLLIHVIGGDWGKDESHEEDGFVPVKCIRGAEYRNWDKEKGSTATARKVKSSSLESRRLREGDILIEISGGGPDQPVGRVVLIDHAAISTQKGADLVPTNFLRLARPSEHINSTYLNAYLRAFYMSGEVIKYQAGSNNLRNLKFKDYVTIDVPVAPLAEQKQIAAKLDGLLAQVNILKTRLDAIPVILKRFRQSVLAAAVSGRLTEEWRGRSKSLGIKEKPLKQVIASLDQGWSPKCKNTPATDSEWGVIKTSAVQKIKFESNENKALPPSLNERPQLGLRKNDILITRAGPRVRCGVTCIVGSDHPQLMICDKVYRVRVLQDEVVPIYLAFLLNSPQYLDKIEKLKTGSSDSGMNLTQKKFYALKAKFPSIEEQTEIVRRVAQLFTFADQIGQHVKDAQARVNHLTQSILAKAFRGELTAEWREQNPDLISGENSAEALLDKIKAENQKISTKKTRKKRA